MARVLLLSNACYEYGSITGRCGKRSAYMRDVFHLTFREIDMIRNTPPS